MRNQAMIAEGRWQYKAIAFTVLTCALFACIHESWGYITIFLTLFLYLASAVLGLMFYLQFKGRRMRTVLFLFLMFNCFFNFLIVAPKFEFAGFLAVLRLLTSMSYLAAALYIPYSTEIGAFLDEVEEKRDQAKQTALAE